MIIILTLSFRNFGRLCSSSHTVYSVLGFRCPEVQFLTFPVLDNVIHICEQNTMVLPFKWFIIIIIIIIIIILAEGLG